MQTDPNTLSLLPLKHRLPTKHRYRNIFSPKTQIKTNKGSQKSGLRKMPGNRFFDIKATPRFELGVKDLQSSALPLGHVAKSNVTTRLLYPFLTSKSRENYLSIISSCKNTIHVLHLKHIKNGIPYFVLKLGSIQANPKH